MGSLVPVEGYTANAFEMPLPKNALLVSKLGTNDLEPVSELAVLAADSL